jgi:membrane-bound lytic murein transglycosylase B
MATRPDGEQAKSRYSAVRQPEGDVALPMTTRRTVLTSLPIAAALGGTAFGGNYTGTPQDAASFARYIEGVKAAARSKGIAPAVLQAAFANVRINARVIELDRNQPEVQFTWARYRTLVVSDARVAGGRAQFTRHSALLQRVEAVYGVPGPIVVGLWGLESDYGHDVGNFNVIEAVATLAWEGRRGAYFRSQLMDCLAILNAGDIRPAQMVGSWAGAMGQTQFMPDSFLKYAVDFDHRGARDLWNDLACVFASTANNLAKEGWRHGVPWGARVVLPAGFDPALIGRGTGRKLRYWADLGVRRQDGTAWYPPDKAASAWAELPSALVQPGAPADNDTYLVYSTQFAALRAYNPSDKYALCIGLLADGIET